MTYRGVVLDVDGTVLRGREPIPGAASGLGAMDAAGLRRLFVSNNPTKPPAAYEDRFATAGFDVAASEVVTAGTLTTAYLEANHRDDALFLIGSSGLRAQFVAAGLRVVDDPSRADAVVASIDRSFGYETLSTALGALSNAEVSFVGTDPDVVIPAADRDVPGSGAIINAIADVTGRDPDVVCGKPSAQARRVITNRLGADPKDCLVVGDRLDTDILLGERAGMTTALVTTGVTDRATLDGSTIEPDYVFDSLAEVESLL
ncbi:HAD-IIA family hydrolase [Haloferacaceae archaeon DSL9]